MLEKIRAILRLLDAGDPITKCRTRQGLHTHELTGKDKGAWMRLNPAHPGEILKEGFFDDWDDYPGMTVTAAARKIGMSRVHLSWIVNQRAPITMDVAMKLEAVGWDTADSWLQFQLKFDLAQERKRTGRKR